MSNKSNKGEIMSNKIKYTYNQLFDVIVRFKEMQQEDMFMRNEVYTEFSHMNALIISNTYEISNKMAYKLWCSQNEAAKKVAIMSLNSNKMSIFELELMIIVEENKNYLDYIYKYLIKDSNLKEELVKIALVSKNMNLRYIMLLIIENLKSEAQKDMLLEKARVTISQDYNFSPIHIKEQMEKLNLN